jgi:hypothetical protein
MKKIWVTLLTVGWGVVVSGAAEDVFSKAVRAEDFVAAGLGKLSAEELARLDVLVREFRSGRADETRVLAEKLAAARREAEIAAAARAAAEAKTVRAEAETKAVRVEAETKAARVESAQAKKTEGGLLAKAKVLLTPGTEIEYTTVESRIAGNFTGWEGRAVLTLENGQRWQIANGGSYMTPPLANPAVKIVPASLGGFWMTIQGVANRVRVTPFGAK